MEVARGSRVRVRVCVPGSIIRELRVNPSMRVGDLKRYLPSPDCELLFSGVMLSDGSSLNSYDIREDDFLISIPKASDNQILNQQSLTWARVTHDNDAFTERMKCILNPNVSSELARIKDLRMMRLSERPGMINKLHQIYTVQQEKQCGPPTIVPPPTGDIEAPSISPLPILWDENETQEELASTHNRSSAYQRIVC